jgi:hypothetical protein
VAAGGQTRADGIEAREQLGGAIHDGWSFHAALVGDTGARAGMLPPGARQSMMADAPPAWQPLLLDRARSRAAAPVRRRTSGGRFHVKRRPHASRPWRSVPQRTNGV